jgi:hypothetical protein
VPQVVVAVVAAIGYAAASAGTVAALGGVAAATAFTVGGIAVSVGTVAAVVGAVAGAVLAYAGNALVASMTGPGKGKQDTSTAATDAKRTIRSEVAPRRIVYGRARVSGPLIYAGSFGEALEYLLLVIPLADHEIEAIDAVWIGEHRIDATEIGPTGDVIAGRFGGTVPGTPIPYVSIRRFLGNQTAADPQLVAECPDGWRAQDKLTGIAHLVVRLRFQPDLFQGGIPSISAEVRGKRLLDPRTGTTAYSDNWALIVHDYLRGQYGLAATADEIDTDSFIAAANLADENVQITQAGATQKRYILNGSFTLDRQPIDVLEEMLAPAGGALVYTAGRYRLFGGAYQAPAVFLSAEDLASDVEVVTKPPRRELFNSVRGNYIDPNAYWQAFPMPALEWQPFIAEDGEQIWRELELPWVLDPVRAQRIAKQLLLRSRQGVTIRASFKYASLNLSVWQIVGMTVADLGWTDKPFRITGWSFSPDTGLITLTMQEEQIASYAWTWDEAATAPEFPDTTLIDPFQTPAPAGLSVTEELYVTRDGAGVRTKAVLDWLTPASPFVVGYDIEFKEASATDWRASPGAVNAPGEVLDLAAGTWDFRVRARTSVAAGAWATVRREVGGLAAQPPAAITGLSLSTIGGLAFLRWDRSPDVDVRVGGRYEVRHTPETAAPTWAGATSLGEAISGEASIAVLPLKPGTYFVRAVDASGIYGPEVSIGASQGAALAFANVTSVPQHPTFAGAKTGTVVTSSTLRLDSLGNVDGEASFDAIADLDRLGGFAPSGSYTFSGGIDLGSVRGIRLTSRLLALVENSADEWDARTELVDAWGSIDAVFGGEADAWVEARSTNDDPGGSPVWSDWRRLDSAEFTARGFQFRAQLRSSDASFNIHISELSVSADEVV